MTTSFPGSSLFLSQGRKREDPGNEVDCMNDVIVKMTGYAGKFGRPFMQCTLVKSFSAATGNESLVPCTVILE